MNRKDWRPRYPKRLKSAPFRVFRGVLLILSVSSLALNIGIMINLISAQSSSLGLFSYKFIVDEDGLTFVTINYQSARKSGSSWVLVPNFLDWTNNTIKGEVTDWALCDAKNYLNEEYYFYQILNFSFVHQGSGFEMNIKFNFSTAAIIIEPNGIFYSPQIGFERGNDFKAEAVFPSNFRINSGEAVAYGSRGTYKPSSAISNASYVLFNELPETENLIRIEIGFKIQNKTPDLLTIERGIFSFETVRRYENYAQEILDLYNRTYGDLVSLFNVTLERATVHFFLPDFTSIFTIGGYVPFSGKTLGDIHINIIFTRYVKGYIEVIALHELVHHFLWEAGISPQTLLWFHEGMAQYVSIDLANKLGYEGASLIKQEIEDDAKQLKQTVGDNLGFLKDWTLSREPRNTETLYVAAYYVISKLAENHSGLEYYASFFKIINGKKIDDNIELGYYLSLAANESVVTTLNSWKFGILDLYVYSSFIMDAESIINGVNPIFQPYKLLAKILYLQALTDFGRNPAVAKQYLAAAVLVARLAPLLTLVTLSGILFGAILLTLKKEGVFQE